MAQAGGPRFEAVSTVEETLTDEPFEVSFRLLGGRVRNFEPPSFAGLEARGPQIFQSTAHVNGRTMINEIYTFYVRASKPGTYQIAPATVITTEGKSFRSKPLTIKVIQAKKRPNAYGTRLMVQMEVNTDQAVVGEQVNVDIRLFHTREVNIEQSFLIRQPSFENSFAYNLQTFRDPGEYRVVDGVQYYTEVIQRWAVFPNKPGNIVIEPAVLDINIQEDQGNSSLFIPYRLIRQRLQTDSLVVQVQDLDGGPLGYDGAIGCYELQAYLERPTIASDEMVELIVRLQGQGNIKTVLPPRLEGDLRFFDHFDPAMEEQAGVIQGQYGGIKLYTYALTPKATGSFEIRPTITYFNPQARKFVTIDTTLQIQIQPGSIPLPDQSAFDTVQTAAERVAAETEAALLEFRAPAQTAQWSRRNAAPFWGSVWFWLLLLLPFGAVAFAAGWQRQRAQQATQPDTLRRQANARSHAQKRLATAQQAQSAGNAAGFYKALSEALLGFVKDRYQLSTLELTKQNVRQVLEQHQMAAPQIEQFMQLLHTADQALFAGLTSEASMDQSYRDGIALLETLDQA